MTWLKALYLVLQLAAFLARRAERRDVEEAVRNELKLLMDQRVDAAVDAGNRPHDDSVPDPFDRANRRKPGAGV